MPPFEAPSPLQCQEYLCEWQKHVTPDMQSPDLLFGEYWRRYNTVRVPILGQHRYLDNAIEIAKLSENRTDLERIFGERNKQLEKKILTLMRQAANQTIYTNIFPCLDASDKAFTASTTGALIDFAALLQGLAFGWEADRADEEQSNFLNHQSSLTQVCDVNPRYQTPEQNQPDSVLSAKAMGFLDTVTHERCATPASDDTNAVPESELSEYGKQYTGQMAEELRREHDHASSTQQAADSTTGGTHRDTADQHERESTQSMSEEERVRSRGTHDACLVHQESIPNATTKEAAIKERPRPSINGLKNPSSLHLTSANPSRKRLRCDDNTDEVYDGRVHQRRKLESPSMLGATSISDHGTSRKRPRCDDDDDDDVHNDRVHQRRKLESPYSPHHDNDGPYHRQKSQRPRTSAAYTPMPHDITSLQGITSNRVVKKTSTIKNDTRRRLSSRNGERASQRLERPPGPVHTRSTRRGGQSTLWELDHSGKARQV